MYLPINFPYYKKLLIALLDFHPHLSQKLLLETLPGGDNYRSSCSETFCKNGCSEMLG